MYWTYNSIPELKGLSPDAQIRIWRRNEGTQRNRPAYSFLTILLWIVIALPCISLFDGAFNFTPQSCRSFTFICAFIVPAIFIIELLRFQLQAEGRRPFLRNELETCCRLCGCQHPEALDGTAYTECESAILTDSSPGISTFFRINLSSLFAITTISCRFFFYVNQRLSNYEFQQDVITQLKAKKNCKVISTPRIGPGLGRPFRNVEMLRLYGNFDDSDIEALVELPYLEMLLLDGTQITDASSNTLATLSNLRFLSLRNTRFTGEGIASLQQALPNVDISHNFPVLRKRNPDP